MSDPASVRITHVGGPTALIEVAGWRLLTDPTFDPAGGKYSFGWGTGSQKLTDPSASAEALLPIDAVLLSHDHHDDNLDKAGRAFLPQAGTTVTTEAGAKRLRRDGLSTVRGLAPWATTTLDPDAAADADRAGRVPLTITATPCRHGPPGSRPIVGDVIGFALRWEGAAGALWISGDTVLYDGVREVGPRIGEIDVAVIHLGGVRFPITGPVRFTMTAREGIELCSSLRPRVVVPLHYEGWKHFREGRSAIEAELAGAPADVRERVRWLPIGEPVELGG
jgi:L-ascorbate metabolism protein UlaG (beta-lactamase superfamily)